jgi:deoxyadenosine/deoxycytidine kinase
VKQISKRGRDFEQGIQRSYLMTLNALYEDWIQRYSLGPLLIIESDNLDFVNNKKDLDYILATVKDHLPQLQLFE